MGEPLALIREALMAHAQHGIPLSSAARSIAARFGLDPLMVRAIADSMVAVVRPVKPSSGQ